MSVVKITVDNFEQEVLESEKTVLIDFWSDWCGPCKVLSPVIDEIAEEVSDVKVCKVNIDEEPELAIKYQVMSIPTLKVLKKGQVTGSSVGVQPKDSILEMLS